MKCELSKKRELNPTKWYLVRECEFMSLVALQSQIEFANMVVLFRSIAHLNNTAAFQNAKKMESERRDE